MSRGWGCVAVTLLLVGVAPARAAVCMNYNMALCGLMNDGGCRCVWAAAGCEKGNDCSGVGPTSAGCMMENGTYIEDGASMPGQGDQWCNTCYCTSGELHCTEIDCGPDGACMMDDGTQLEDGASMPGQGDQWCNTCTCWIGELHCTETDCGQSGGACMMDDGTELEDGASMPGHGDQWCNTCYCSGGELHCTETDCGQNGGACMMDDGTELEDGASMPGRGDQWCNTCYCSGGELHCTEMDCGDLTMTCGDVKEAYQDSGCCDDPDKLIDFGWHGGGRRLSTAAPGGDDVIAHVLAVLQEAAATGDRARVRQLAERVRRTVAPLAGA